MTLNTDPDKSRHQIKAANEKQLNINRTDHNRVLYIVSILSCISFLAFIVWIIFQANSGGNNIFFDLVRAIPYGDKLGHFCLFGSLTAISLLASKCAFFTLNYDPSNPINPRKPIRIYYAVGIISIFVLLEEISQGFIATRTFDISDLIADVLGISLFSYITIKLVSKYRHRYVC
ncbi:VanZ family protein [Shewanella olleyana]|uniref:VanZ family protein n=1 Tax=Shewanella olleyana TaxID=135626 RepID=UPI00200EB433|nr:VanZ family protein [Shewanella olleyana]MCL1065562.1 VanZ family protein [Shewanella olleyana]